MWMHICEFNCKDIIKCLEGIEWIIPHAMVILKRPLLYFFYKTKVCSKTNQFENPSINILLCSLIYWWVLLYILVDFSPYVCLGLFQHLLNWIPLKITFIKNSETSFSQVRSWILLRSEWLARVAGQRQVWFWTKQNLFLLLSQKTPGSL